MGICGLWLRNLLKYVRSRGRNMQPAVAKYIEINRNLFANTDEIDRNL